MDYVAKIISNSQEILKNKTLNYKWYNYGWVAADIEKACKQ